MDEPAHLAAGMELVDRGTYTYEYLHPPIARIAGALGPYLLGGSRHIGLTGIIPEGNAILYRSADYERTLSLARAGILPFFFSALYGTWLMARRLLGRPAAVLAVGLLSFSPTMLAHSGLATTDAALVGFGVPALYALLLWFERPDRLRTLAAAVLVSLAVLSKFSAAPFLAVCFIALVSVRYGLQKGWKIRGFVAQIRVAWLGLAVGVAVLLCWAAYGFNVSPTAMATPSQRPHELADRFFTPGTAIHDAAYRVIEFPVLPRFLAAMASGVFSAQSLSSAGRNSVLFGQTRTKGWWYYFPVALAVKTTLPLLALCLIGSVLLVSQVWRDRDWKLCAPLTFTVAILGLSMTSSFNIGVRHVLLVYPMMAVLGAYAASRIYTVSRRHSARNWAVAAVLAAHAVVSLKAHPDYLPYFNALAGSKPEKILVDSNLDWGQDLKRLGQELKRRGVQRVGLLCFCSADPARHGLPPFYDVQPEQSPAGWVAVSLQRKVQSSETFPWLEEKEPVTRVGRSIDLYYFEEVSAP